MRLGQESEKHLPDQQQTTSAGADYYITQFSVTEMDENGNPQHRLESEYLAHFVHNDTVEMTNTRATLFRSGKAEWQLDARHAFAETRGEILQLSGGVSARKIADGEHTLTEFNTDSMKVWPKRHFAETDDPVVITGPGSRIDAVGMTADLKEEQVELRSAVRGYYEPQNQTIQP